MAGRRSDGVTRQELFTWIHQQYGTEPEYPWHDRNAVLRHKDNNKWYGVVLEVSADKLGLPETGIMDVLNVKSDPLLIGSLRGQDGYFPAYHMNKEKWLSIQLGKPELDDAIKAVGAAEGVIYIFDLARTSIPYVNEAQSINLTNKVKANLGIK